jgi:hypothetical protein
MKIGKGNIVGLGVASLLVALPAAAQYSSGGSSGGSSKGSSGSSESSGSMGTGSSGSSSGSMGTESPTKQSVTGTVDKVDPSSNQLSIMPKVDSSMQQMQQDHVRLKTSSSTEVTKDGQKATLSDVKEGDQVRASLSPSGTVQRIDVVSSGSSGSKAGSGTSPHGGMGGPSGTTGGSSPSGGMGSESK